PEPRGRPRALPPGMDDEAAAVAEEPGLRVLVLLRARGHREEVPVVRARGLLGGRHRTEHRLQSRARLVDTEEESGPHFAPVVAEEGEDRPAELSRLRRSKSAPAANERRPGRLRGQSQEGVSGALHGLAALTTPIPRAAVLAEPSGQG